ncbi:ATP-binding protein [Streptomyces sp. NPDC091219]|uniref:ATP-binding protein n=1 Tax=Streptomyces sp. NPDC091219 TaxID=3155193 RepID=UPI00344FF7C1
MSEAQPPGGDAKDPAGNPLQTTVALEGDGTDIALARHLAVEFLTRGQAEHGLKVSQRGMDLTQLVVSELVTNARKYAPGPVVMDLRTDGDVIEVTVWDTDPILPAARAADAGRVGQHGLEIITAITRRFEARQEPVGKRITAHVSLTDDATDTLPHPRR